MKIAILSDTHFGDNGCTLVTQSVNGDLVQGSMYKDFKDAAGLENDYLIMVGDIFDFSIASYEDAYRIGQAFFKLIQQDSIAREIIYIAGNHDTDLWHIVQHQRSVINRLSQGNLPYQYEHSVAGILDDRYQSPTNGFWLNKVQAKKGPGAKYGNMFLDNITGVDHPTIFNFAYPNLYIITDQESVLVTHGQYLEPYWSLLGEFALKLAYDDLKVGEVDLEEMVELNYPLNQLACTGLGQAGVLTPVIYKVMNDVKMGDLARVKKYVDRLEKVIDDMTQYGWLKELVVDFLLRKVKGEVLDSIGKTDKTRYNEEFIYKKEVQERFRNFYNAGMLEIGAINEISNREQPPGFNIPAPWKVIFGHTHQPIAWNDANAPKLDTVSSASPRRLTLHNTGGWLMNAGQFCGAEIFKYETGKGFSSVRINGGQS